MASQMITGFPLATQYTRRLSAGLVLLLLVLRTTALSISYCSPDNTGDSYPQIYQQYQSNGLCHDACKSQYAYAVVQGSYCWCSNYAPANQVGTLDCNTVCPGDGYEWCGNTQQGLFGYFQIQGSTPSGTAGAASSTASSSSPPSSSNPPVSSTPYGSGFSFPRDPTTFPRGSSSLTVTTTMQSFVATSSSTSTSSSSSTPPPSTSSSSTTSSAPAQVTSTAVPTQVYTSVVTVTGQVRTIQVTPTPPSDSTLGSSSSTNGGGGVSTGKVVGIVVGVALGLGLLIGLGVWLWLRRRHQRQIESASVDGGSTTGATNIPSRQVSQMSSAGLLHKAPRIQTAGLVSGSGPRSAEGPAFDRRSLATDQRLNPYALYAHDESRHSNVSLQDNQDYSRQLRVANPDA